MSTPTKPAAPSAARRGTLAMLANPRGLWRYLRDPATPKVAKAGVVLAALYVVVPTDMIPDIAPVIGWLDDLGMTAVALTFLARQAARYEDKAPASSPAPRGEATPQGRATDEGSR